MPLAAKFNGPRDPDTNQPVYYISGVPAGDVEAETWAALPEERRLAAQQAVMGDGKKLYTVYSGHRVADPGATDAAPAEAAPATEG